MDTVVSDIPKTKPWFGFLGGPYQGNAPAFYNKEDLPWTKILEDNYELIRKEALDFLENRDIDPYPTSLSFPPKKWKAMGILFWKITFRKNQKHFPETAKVLKTIPHIVGYSISILEPGTTIKPHNGDTDTTIRCHMPLVVPGTLPACGFKVLDEERSWEEGKALPFCDAQRHTAWNKTDQRRLIMIVDVVHPEYARKTNYICSRVMGALLVGLVKKKVGFVKRSTTMKRILLWTFTGFVRLYFGVQSLRFW